MRANYLLLCFFAIFGCVHLLPAGEKDEEYQDTESAVKPITEPKIYNVEPGHKITLPCEAENLSDEIAVWRRHTDESSTPELLTHDAKVRSSRKDFTVITEDDKYFLNIPDVRDEDSGKYTCLYLQGNHEFEIVTHRINVYRKPAINKIVPEEKHIYVKEGEHLTLACQTSGFPEPRVSWRREGRNLPNGEREHMGSTLHLGAATHKFSGTYKCEAHNNQGEPAIRTVKVSVKSKPTVEVKTEMVHSGPGVISELFCTVHSYMRPTVKWLKNGVEITDGSSDNIEIIAKDAHHHNLKFSPTALTDFGVYECRADNDLGFDIKTIELSVKPSKPVKDKVEKTVDQANPVVSWKVTSYSSIVEYDLKYKRQEDDKWMTVDLPVGQPADGVYHPHHTFSSLRQGTYHAVLRARNEHGWSEPSEKTVFSGALTPRLASAGVLLQESQSSSAAKEQVSLLTVFIFSILAARWLQ